LGMDRPLVSGSVPRPLYRGGLGTGYGVGNGIGEPAGTDPVFVGFLGNRFGEPAGTEGGCRRGVGSPL